MFVCAVHRSKLYFSLIGTHYLTYCSLYNRHFFILWSEYFITVSNHYLRDSLCVGTSSSNQPNQTLLLWDYSRESLLWGTITGNTSKFSKYCASRRTVACKSFITKHPGLSFLQQQSVVNTFLHWFLFLT